jgi:hypothetical protein
VEGAGERKVATELHHHHNRGNGPVHDRMPVNLHPVAFNRWLYREPTDFFWAASSLCGAAFGLSLWGLLCRSEGLLGSNRASFSWLSSRHALTQDSLPLGRPVSDYRNAATPNRKKKIVFRIKREHNQPLPDN